MDMDDTCGDHQEIHVTTTEHETETESCRVQIGLSPTGKGNDTEGTDHVSKEMGNHENLTNHAHSNVMSSSY